MRAVRGPRVGVVHAALSSQTTAPRPQAAPSHAPRARVTARNTSSRPVATPRTIRSPPRARRPAPRLAATPNGSAIAITSAAMFLFPNVEPGVLKTGIESADGSIPTCWRRPTPATIAAASVIASASCRRASGASARTLAPHAIPNRDAHRASASAAYGAPSGRPRATTHESAVVPRTSRAPVATRRDHRGLPDVSLSSANATAHSAADSSSAANFGTRKGAASAGE